MPASISPTRVDIGSPSIALNPIEVSTLLPSSMAHRLQPPPRWATMTRRASGAYLGSCRLM